jgi:hypothetical protein
VVVSPELARELARDREAVLDDELTRALRILGRRHYVETYTTVREARYLGLTNAHAEAVLAAILLGATYTQALEMLELIQACGTRK